MLYLFLFQNCKSNCSANSGVEQPAYQYATGHEKQSTSRTEEIAANKSTERNKKTGRDMSFLHSYFWRHIFNNLGAVVASSFIVYEINNDAHYNDNNSNPYQTLAFYT